MFNPFNLFRKSVSMLEIKVVRFQFTEESTIGELYLNGTLFAYTLEDVDRGLVSTMTLDEIKSIKIQNETCIPYGNYDIDLYNSPKHGYLVPLLKNVLGFDMVEMHIGNTKKDTDACILVGSSIRVNMVQNSKITFQKLMNEIVKYNKITISIQKKV